MGDNTSAFDPAKYNYELDAGMQSVMPDNWVGHARIALYEMADGVSLKKLRFAYKLLKKIHNNPDKYSGLLQKTPEERARICLRKTEEKFDE